MENPAQEPTELIEVTITGDEARFDWWTKGIGDVICDSCGDCAGWASPERPPDCFVSNPYCG